MLFTVAELVGERLAKSNFLNSLVTLLVFLKVNIVFVYQKNNFGERIQNRKIYSLDFGFFVFIKHMSNFFILYVTYMSIR